MKSLKSAGLDIAYLDTGKGPTVIIGHCSCASHKEWLPLIGELESDWRVLAPDFIGYGRSQNWPGDGIFSGNADLGVLLDLAKKTKRPLHLVGHLKYVLLDLHAAWLMWLLVGLSAASIVVMLERALFFRGLRVDVAAIADHDAECNATDAFRCRGCGWCQCPRSRSRGSGRAGGSWCTRNAANRR